MKTESSKLNYPNLWEDQAMKRSATIVISDWLANCSVGQWTPFEAATALKEALRKEGYGVTEAAPQVLAAMPAVGGLISKDIAKLMDKHGISPPPPPRFWIDLEQMLSPIQTTRETCHDCGKCEPCDDDCPNYGDAATPAVVILPREKSDRLLGECGYETKTATPAVGGETFDAWFNSHFLDPDGGSTHLPDWLKDDLRSAWNAALAATPAGDALREAAFKLSCRAQFDLATKIAENVGYVLVGEPSFDDSAMPAVGGEELGYATRLLEHFVAEHFPHNPDWKPLPDLIGVLTQIDNAITIARDYKARLAAQPASPLRVEDARHEVANWMIGEDYVTGHGDTLDDLMQELVTQAQQAVLSVSASWTDKHAAVTEDELTEIMDETWSDGHRAVAKKIIERLSAKDTPE
jgi:hypothetical protein